MANTCQACGFSGATEEIPGLSFYAATGVVEVDGKKCRLQPRLLDFLEILIDAFPRPLTSLDIADELLPNTNGDQAALLISVYLCNTRKVFRKSGIPLEIATVPSPRSDRSKAYKLVRTGTHEQHIGE